jgi:hypothetical protein
MSLIRPAKADIVISHLTTTQMLACSVGRSFPLMELQSSNPPGRLTMSW